jgi:hypothetical protein
MGMLAMFVVVGMIVGMHGAVGMAMFVSVGMSMLARMNVVRWLCGFARTIRLAVDDHIDLGRGDAAAVHA